MGLGDVVDGGSDGDSEGGCRLLGEGQLRGVVARTLRSPADGANGFAVGHVR